MDRRLLFQLLDGLIVKRINSACAINDAVISVPTMEKNRKPSNSGHNDIAIVKYKNFLAMFAKTCLPVKQYTTSSRIMMQVSNAVIKGEKLAYPKGRRSK